MVDLLKIKRYLPAKWVCMKKLYVICLFFIFSGFFVGASASPENDEPLGALVKTKIYSASKKPEDGNKSPSALYVLTEEDIRQTGVRFWVDALRFVPGLQVARISANKWAVGSRGFGGQFTNNLLVLIDGRPVYTTLFSGVVWDQQDIPIQDIKQIEVIRGPGATLWGSNAVNGVVNVITKSSEETIGTALSTTVGFTTDTAENQTVLEATHGKRVNDHSTWRTTFKLREDPSFRPVFNNSDFDDSWEGGSANFRYDSMPSSQNSLTVQGNFFLNNSQQTYMFPSLTPPFDFQSNSGERSRGGNVLIRQTQGLSDNRSLTFEGAVDFFDWTFAENNFQLFNASFETQYDFILFEDWQTIASAGYRLTADRIDNGPFLMYDPNSDVTHFYNALFQTQIPLVKNKLFLTAGTRVESNSFADLALSPSIKLSYQPDPTITLWSSFARANRIPSRGTFNLTTILAGTPGGFAGVLPSLDFQPEVLDAYEIGLRVNPIAGLSIDATAFFNQYDDLRTFEPIAPFGPFAAASVIDNQGEAVVRGVEVSARYQTTPAWWLQLAYSHHQFSFSTSPTSSDNFFTRGAGSAPRNTWSARTSYKISNDITFNFSAAYSDELPSIGIDSYTKIDANIAWRAFDDAEVIFGVDNATDNLHPEFSAPLFGERLEVPRITYITFKASM